MKEGAALHETRHLAYLDGWRGIAILLVLVGHFAHMECGHVGVDVFFVLSGLLMSRILFVDEMPLGTFYIRRIARIFPVLYLFLGIMAIITFHYVHPFSILEFVYAGLFVRMYFPGGWTNYHPIDHLWSLSVEEHCYVFLSLICACFRGKGPKEILIRYCVTVCAAACFFFYCFYKKFPPENLPLEYRTECASFAIMISSSVFLWMRKFNPSIPKLMPIVLTAGAIVVSTHVTHGPWRFIVAPMLLALAVNSLQFSPEWFLRLLSHRVLTWFGICSYSIYVWQQPFFSLNKTGYWKFGGWEGAAFALMVGACSFYFFEQPMRKWIRKLGGDPKPTPVTEEPADITLPAYPTSN